MLAPLPLVQPFKVKLNLNELQVLHFLQNYGYIINNQKENVIATSTGIESYINLSMWWADFLNACNKINQAYKQANDRQKNAGINLTYSETAALYKVITRIDWDKEDSYAQVVIYTLIDKMHKYLC